MAKGNMLLGYSRGAVGDVVFSRIKGQQVVRARNRKPANPKTQSQMIQRIKFASVVRFYNDGVQNLFRFAFQNKDAKQSDYNAFVSANASNGVFISPMQVRQESPIIYAPFKMTSGTLRRNIKSAVVGTNSATAAPRHAAGFIPELTLTEEVPTTVAELTSLLLLQGFEVGDIITLVTIGSALDGPPMIYDRPINEQPTEWILKQFTLSTTDTSTLASHGIVLVNTQIEGVDSDTQGVVITTPTGGAEFESSMGAVIVSRNTEDGLHVTNSTLALSNTAMSIYQWQVSEETQALMLDLWNASDPAILQGSLSD